ncbi:hypothetical protein DTO280E4_1370 [Paecilomyces variotii]|nr:hypothetical protein DTO280E4_1370 [Paecilomyces variotii]
MPPPPHIKPENVLKRAQELIAVGQAPAALTVLHEHVTSKRTRSTPIASLEPVMILFVELCVDLRKGKAAKDGLYQYKNIAQNTNVGTIETVLKKFIELAEQKVTEAQAKADEIQSSLESAAPSTNVEDLEAIETPETILLATVSGEQSRDRTDRAVVTPWLKFLWETYRTVLEILKNNARLEVMYQTTALQAFQFCLKYTRKTEFRRLCELLRNHVQNAAKYSAQMHSINLSDPDTLQRHLDTRFQQLNVAVELELWQEAFRSVEDIHTLLSLSKRPAKNVMMANYYEKLTRIFLVSENYLFHAAAWSRYYNLLRQSAATLAAGQGSKKDNPSVTEADMTKTASFVLLSALAIPVISTSRSRGALVDVDEVRKNKNARLTNLLGMAQHPTRAALFKDALNKGLLKRVRPEIRDLYNILEVDFHPLSICKKITPILQQIGADPEMEKYVVPLQQVILTRLFQQLSQVYETVELKFVYELAQFPEPFQITRSMIEKFIMNGCKKGDLAIRAIHSGSAAGSAESDLSRLAKTLHITCMYVDPSYNEARVQAKQLALARAQAGAAKEHEEALARRVIIEKRKEAATDALQRKQREEETRKRIRTQQLQEAEKQRLLDEQREREKKRIKDEQDRIRQQELKKQLEELKSGVKGIDQLEKEKNELNDRIRITAKRIDHLERAFRREELKHIPEDYEQQKQRDLEIYEKIKEQTLKEAEQKHKEDELNEKRHEEFEKRRKAAEREFEQKKKQRVKEVQERRRRERMEQEEQRRKLAELKAQREEERRKLDEIAAKQREREEEAERRRAMRKTAPAPAAVAEPPVRAETAERTAPRLNLAPRTAAAGGPSWRERQAAKEAAGGAPEAPKEDVPPLRRTGGYVPPHQRGAATSVTPRDASPANGGAPERTQTPPAASGDAKPAGGKWVPRWKQQQS